LVSNLEGVVMRLVPQDCEALRLLVKYLAILRENTTLGMPELRHLAVTHVYHLVAMALSSTRSGSPIANAHEAGAMRLRAIKADILENLGDLELSVTSIALRQRITPRYVHMLFGVEGITFSQFVLNQRLISAHSMLCDPRSTGLSITAIAFAVGFSDLSHFNRTFRRRFGATPSELRNANACKILDHDGLVLACQDKWVNN
jgi:AraC-like DNA-binding protein